MCIIRLTNNYFHLAEYLQLMCSLMILFAAHNLCSIFLSLNFVVNKFQCIHRFEITNLLLLYISSVCCFQLILSCLFILFLAFVIVVFQLCIVSLPLFLFTFVEIV